MCRGGYIAFAVAPKSRRYNLNELLVTQVSFPLKRVQIHLRLSEFASVNLSLAIKFILKN